MSEDTKNHVSIGAIVVGIVKLYARFNPICGGPLAIVGITRGALGVASQQLVPGAAICLQNRTFSP